MVDSLYWILEGCHNGCSEIAGVGWGSTLVKDYLEMWFGGCEVEHGLAEVLSELRVEPSGTDDDEQSNSLCYNDNYIANNICIVIQIEYILDNFDDSPPKPSSYVINRLVDLVCAACRKATSETIPPTRLYIPKSVSPKAWSTKREVYSDTNITMAVRIYSAIVFFAILLLSAFIDIENNAINSKP